MDKYLFALRIAGKNDAANEVEKNWLQVTPMLNEELQKIVFIMLATERLSSTNNNPYVAKKNVPKTLFALPDMQMPTMTLSATFFSLPENQHISLGPSLLDLSAELDDQESINDQSSVGSVNWFQVGANESHDRPSRADNIFVCENEQEFDKLYNKYYTNQNGLMYQVKRVSDEQVLKVCQNNCLHLCVGLHKCFAGHRIKYLYI